MYSENVTGQVDSLLMSFELGCLSTEFATLSMDWPATQSVFVLRIVLLKDSKPTTQCMTFNLVCADSNWGDEDKEEDEWWADQIDGPVASATEEWWLEVPEGVEEAVGDLDLSWLENDPVIPQD
eukprot:5589664-Amphidinium_carterae.1